MLPPLGVVLQNFHNIKDMTGLDLSSVHAAVTAVVLLAAAVAHHMTSRKLDTCASGKTPSSARCVVPSVPPRNILSPEECWAREFGRFKHRGLRPDPFDPADGPPEYSFEQRPELPVPQLSAENTFRLDELERRVADLASRARIDRSTLVRYLRPRKFNVVAAEKYFRNALVWREKHGVDRLLSEINLKAYEECLGPWWLSGGLLGKSKMGGPVAYEMLARCQWPKLINRLAWHDIELLDQVHCMRSLAALEEDSLRRGVPLGTGVLVEVCDHFGWDQASMQAARAFKRLIKNRDMICPELMRRILVINAPPAWVYAWEMFKHILDPGIVEKVQVASPGEPSLKLLRQWIDNEDIPAMFGGGKVIDSDPECRKVLAPGWPIPDSVLHEFHRLTAEESRLSKGAVSPASSMSTVSATPKAYKSKAYEDQPWWACCQSRD